MTTPHETMIERYGMMRGHICAECAHCTLLRTSFRCAIFAKDAPWIHANWRLGWLTCGAFQETTSRGEGTP